MMKKRIRNKIDRIKGKKYSLRTQFFGVTAFFICAGTFAILLANTQLIPIIYTLRQTKNLTIAAEEIGLALYESKDALFDTEHMSGSEIFREIERAVLLQNVDRKWMDHLEAMDSLMETIGLQAYAQRNPISEYRIVGSDLFDEMVTMIRDDTVRMLLSVMPRPQVMKREQVANPVAAGLAGSSDGTLKKKPVVKKASEKVGRNDPCPCGSGKKYKKCCGANNNDNNQ